MNYISYTATPYANCLNEIGEETLYPKNFIRTLDITKSYFGPDKIFEVDTLPRAILRFRQGCGRLIRNERDHGVFVVLDQRVWNKSYGEQFLSGLPVSAKKVSNQQLLNVLRNSKQNE